MNKDLNKKFITFDLLSFKSEIELEAFLKFDEEAIKQFFNKLKTVGCINVKISRIWNKGETYKAMVVFIWKDGKQIKERNIIFNKFVRENKFWRQVVVKSEMFEAFLVQEFN